MFKIFYFNIKFFLKCSEIVFYIFYGFIQDFTIVLEERTIILPAEYISIQFTFERYVYFFGNLSFFWIGV